MTTSDHAGHATAAAGKAAGPALDDVARAHPCWHCWEGVNGLCYARLLRSSPAVVVRAKDPADLHDSIRDWINDH
jgi:hypothetical protein